MNNPFSLVLNMSMTGSIVILLVMLARLILKRSPKIFSYALWAVVLFRLLCPVAFSAPVSVLNALEPKVQEASESTSVIYFIPAEVNQHPDFTFVPAENQSGTEPVQVEEPEHTRLDLMTVASYVWLSGTGIMIAYSVIQYVRLRLKLIGAMAYIGNVYRADYIDTPFVMGFFSPKIYLPSDVPTNERKYIIAHERHHISRCDHIIKLLAYFALCIHWFNPLVWAAFILAGKDMEMSCDEAVIRKMGSQIRADYSASLLRLATHKKIIAGMPLAFGEGDTKGRVMNMAKWKKPKLWVSLICLLLCATILVACAVNPKTAGSSVGTNGTEITGKVTTSNGLNIREEPSTTSATVGNYSDGTIITILEIKDGWGRTDLGWVSLNYITTMDGTPMVDIGQIEPSTATDIENKVKELNIREKPDKSSAVVGQYSNGTTITILETKDGWGRTDQGWIYMDYVNMTDNSTGIITIREAESEADMPTVSGLDMQTALNEEKGALQQCRSVLEQIQSNGACKIKTKQENGPDALNETTLRTDWIHGKDRLHICLIPESGGSSMFGGLLVGGAKYECDSAQQWRESTWWDWTDPWLVSFQWDDSVVAYIDTLTDESGITVMLRIDQPFAEGENEQPHYFVDFNFDTDGTFRNVYVQANVFMNNATTKTESIVSLDPETVNAEIQKEYQNAIG